MMATYLSKWLLEKKKWLTAVYYYYNCYNIVTTYPWACQIGNLCCSVLSNISCNSPTQYSMIMYLWGESVKVKSVYKQTGLSDWGLSWFLYHDVSRSISTPPGWNASPSKGYPQHWIHQYPFKHLSGERYCESKVSSPLGHNTVYWLGLKPGTLETEMGALTMRPPHSQNL